MQARDSRRRSSWVAPLVVAVPVLFAAAAGSDARRATSGCAPEDSADAATRRGRSALEIRVNIPAFRLDLRDSGRVVASYPVAVGTKRYRTPVRRFVVSAVVWNPWWFPPPSEWARDDTVTPPGPSNPMGRAKIELGGAYFVHGSPDSASIGHARSHGCIRMRQDDAVSLARRITLRAGDPADRESLDSIVADTRTVHVRLRDSVVAETVYELAELRDDTLLLHRDVYRRGPSPRAAAASTLIAAGLDTAHFDLRRLPRRSPSSTLRLPLDSLRRRAP